MDNQKTNDGNARNVGSEGSGSSMGKDLNKDQGNRGSAGPSGAGGSLGSGAGTSSVTATGSIVGARATTASADADIAKGASDLHKTIDKAADAAQPVVDRLASQAHAGVDKVSGALTGATERMDEKTRQLTDAYKHFAETGRDYVRSSPATSILVALAAGYTLSKILGRR